MERILWRSALLAAALASLVLACEESRGAGDEDAGLADVIAMPDIGPMSDCGTADTGVPPEGVSFDFCDEVLFKLPIGGQTEDLHDISLWDGKLAYSRGPAGSLSYEVYLFDIADCTEYQLTNGSVAGEIHIHGSEIIFNDFSDSRTEPDYHCADLHSYDLGTWAETKLTDHPYCEWRPVTNGQFLAYTRSVAPGGDSPRENLLWDRQLGTELRFAEPGEQAGYYDISDRYLAWSAYTPLADSVGKDVFVYDLVTQQETHIELTMPYFCYEVRLWGEYLTYNCSEYWVEPPYHLKLYHIPTGEELHLVGDGQTEAGVQKGLIHEHLVMWNTTRYMSEVGIFEANCDIEIYDIDTGVRRRITTQESNLGAVELFFPYALVGRSLGGRALEYFVLDLEQLGVVDEAGHVIDGDPVLDPPP